MSKGTDRNRQLPNKVNTTTLVKIFILHFLSEKSCYGNELIDGIEQNLNYLWKPSPGMIYPLLRNMEEDMLIEGWWLEPDKKTKRNYKITETGLKHYERLKLIYKPQLEESLTIIQNTLKIIY
ncbi:PadR family transcriptional regulator [Clostridium cylindrosporum]|uniref:Transcriptional regulator, PadR-like family n=1 Tax=Clostridium cylindrosporum DSM 605 TaxID=1121307 RepID=A0A0J8DFP2_CLOCY|nr:PadR family transcriptional regulator [Clostridium cylindrosporum]KMT23044.1 transcriptional regulator, PadR-like family [Clostridium cylindrosporum DSM 605]